MQSVGNFSLIVIYYLLSSSKDSSEVGTDVYIPICSLLDLSDPFLLELAANELLDLVFELCEVLSWPIIFELWRSFLYTQRRHCSSTISSCFEFIVEEWLPALLVFQVEVHQHRSIFWLNVGPNIVLADDAPNPLHCTSRIKEAHVCAC